MQYSVHIAVYYPEEILTALIVLCTKVDFCDHIRLYLLAIEQWIVVLLLYTACVCISFSFYSLLMDDNSIQVLINIC